MDTTSEQDQEITELSQKAEEMSVDWARDLNFFIDQGEIGAMVAMSFLLPMMCTVLSNLSEGARQYCMAAIAADGVVQAMRDAQSAAGRVPRLDA